MKKLNALLAADPEFIYKLLDKVKTELKAMLPFGASNSENLNKLYYNIRAQDVAALNFTSSHSRCDRAKIIAKTDFKHSLVQAPYVDTFINGMGVCSELNFLALMVLAREYDFVAKLESIHSDQIHTYIVLTDSHGKEYILDAWSGAALSHDNDLE